MNVKHSWPRWANFGNKKWNFSKIGGLGWDFLIWALPFQGTKMALISVWIKIRGWLRACWKRMLKANLIV